MEDISNCFFCKNNNNCNERIYSLRFRKILRCNRHGLFFAVNNRSVKTNYFLNPSSICPHDIILNINSIYFKTKLMKIKKNLKNIPIKILDIGCGKGEFLSILRDECISYLGIDVDSFVINSCKEKKLSCLKQDIVKFAKENKEEYTAITAFQVIEHLSDPYSFLKAVRGTLKKNGLFLLTTPNNNTPLRKILKSKWFSYNEKEHFVFYNKITLAKLLKSIGFRNISITNDLPRCLSLGYSLYKFVQYYLIDYFLLNKLTPLCQRLKLPIISDPLGDLEALSIK